MTYVLDPITGLRLFGSAHPANPYCGGFHKGERIWYRNSEYFTWREGVLLEMFWRDGDERPQILVRDENVIRGLCLDGKPASNPLHPHPTFDQQTRMITILHGTQSHCPDTHQQQQDLMKLPNANALEVAICLGARLTQHKRQYTWLDDTMVSVNPFQDMPFNRWKFLPNYIEHVTSGGMKKMPAEFGLQPKEPHVWDTIVKAVDQMFAKNEPQSIVDRGGYVVVRSQPPHPDGPCPGPVAVENLSTFSPFCDSYCPIRMQQMPRSCLCCNCMIWLCAGCMHAPHQSSEQVNILLSAFGNAKTPRNDDSSRFAKLIRVYIDKTSSSGAGGKQRPHIKAIRIQDYLLETTRACVKFDLSEVLDEDRTFHILHYLADSHLNGTPHQPVSPPVFKWTRNGGHSAREREREKADTLLTVRPARGGGVSVASGSYPVS